jgi:hypothetical protein
MADLNADGTIEMVVGNFGGGLELLNGNIAVNQGVEDFSNCNFRVYPNPAQGMVTVEGIGLLTVSNLLGQTILTREIDGRKMIALPQGFWLVRLGNTVKKVIVE